MRHRSRSLTWRAPASFGLIVSLVAAAVLGMASPPSWRSVRRPRDLSGAGNDLARLPARTCAAISRVIGSEQHAYWVRHSRGAWIVANPAQRLTVSFARHGVRVSSGDQWIGLGVMRIGRGASLRALRLAGPRIQQNRVSYSAASASEWYANGPLGLEQGFTISRRPVGSSSAPLVVAVSVSGSLRPSLDRAGTSMLLSSARGRAMLRYGQLSVLDTLGRTLEARLALRPGRLAIVIDDRGARYQLTVDATIVNQSRHLYASDAASNDEFGYSVATDGPTIVVGAPYAAAGGKQSGEAYVFTDTYGSSASQLRETARLVPSDGRNGDRFGQSVAVSGSTIVVGAPSAGPTDSSGGSLGQGAVYVFQRPSQGGWVNATQTAELTASSLFNGAGLGSSVAVAGSTIVAGAPNAGSGTGMAYLFEEPSGGWPTTMTQTTILADTCQGLSKSRPSTPLEN
jgi:hypothetical protein